MPLFTPDGNFWDYEAPCYDFCACAHCWNGWVELSFWHRLKNRIKYLYREYLHGYYGRGL